MLILCLASINSLQLRLVHTKNNNYIDNFISGHTTNFVLFAASNAQAFNTDSVDSDWLSALPFIVVKFPILIELD